MSAPTILEKRAGHPRFSSTKVSNDFTSNDINSMSIKHEPQDGTQTAPHIVSSVDESDSSDGEVSQYLPRKVPICYNYKCDGFQ